MSNYVELRPEKVGGSLRFPAGVFQGWRVRTFPTCGDVTVKVCVDVAFAFSSVLHPRMQHFPKSIAVRFGAIPRESRMIYPSRITESSHRFTMFLLCVRKKSTSRLSFAIAWSISVIIG